MTPTPRHTVPTTWNRLSPPTHRNSITCLTQTPLSFDHGDRSGLVIEAIVPKVREVSLDKFVHRNRYVIVVRRYGLSRAQRRAAVDRARDTIGLGFDVMGMLGIKNRDHAFAALSSSPTPFDAGRIVTPAELMQHGDVVYFADLRDASQLLALAAPGFPTWSHDMKP